jgi:hypothetical protein
MTAVSWTLYNKFQEGQKIRERYYAPVALGTMFREVVTYIDQVTQLNLAVAEASIFLPQTLTSLTWTLESAFSDKEKFSELFSAPVTGGKIYLSTISYIDAVTGGIKSVSQSMSPMTPAEVGGVTDVNGQTGSVSLTTSDIPQGTNLYYTDAAADARIAARILTFTSAASAGGGTSETLTVTGLLDTDTVLAVSMKAPGATATSVVNGFGAPAADALPVTYTADPGAGLKVQVTVLR